MTDPRMLPSWVIQFVGDIEYHEDVHRKGEECVKDALDKVPAEVRSYAAGHRSATAAERDEIEQQVRVEICRVEGCKLIENTALGQLERTFRCTRCGETRTKPREVDRG